MYIILIPPFKKVPTNPQEQEILIFVLATPMPDSLSQRGAVTEVVSFPVTYAVVFV